MLFNNQRYSNCFDRTKKIDPIFKDRENYKGRLIEGATTVDFVHKAKFDMQTVGIF